MDQLTTRSTAVLALTMLASTTAAQQHPAIERCMQTDSDSDRIACLEATILAISEGREPPEPASAAAAEPPPETASAVVEEQAADPAPVMVAEPPTETTSAMAEEPAPEPAVESTPAAEPVPAMPEVTEDNVLEVAAAEAAALDIDDQANIGQEQVDARSESREERQARLSEARGLRVAEFEYVGYRDLQVRLENGQIWRQIKGDVQEVRVSVKRNPTVDITESSLGGYKMRLNEINRTIRVRRIR